MRVHRARVVHHAPAERQIVAPEHVAGVDHGVGYRIVAHGNWRRHWLLLCLAAQAKLMAKSIVIRRTLLGRLATHYHIRAAITLRAGLAAVAVRVRFTLGRGITASMEAY